MKLLVVGSVAYDDIETRAGCRKRLLGGSATYFALAAAPFASARIVAVVGADFLEEHEELLMSRKACIKGLCREDGLTFAWGGKYSMNFETRETLYTDLNVFAGFRPELPKDYRDSDIVFLGNIQPSLQAEVLSQMKTPRLVAADTMNLWIRESRAELLELIKKVDVLFINDEEAFEISGEYPLRKAAAALLRLGPRRIVLKRGEHGAFLFGAGPDFFVPSYPLSEIIDPTGAGDSFAGAFLGHLAAAKNLEDAELRRAMLSAASVASFTCEGFGVERLAEVTLDEVKLRTTELARLTRVDL